ncbi:MAG: type VII toxin-antitoxin system HepT family RNase toxin [Microcoleaceae cyanobacterium]
MSIESAIVLTRLGFIGKNLQKLKRFENITLTEYLDDSDLQTISERFLQVIIQASIDINKHLLTQGYQISSITYKESFQQLGDYEILPRKLAEELSSAASLRNVLAHQYLDIDHTQLFTYIQKVLLLYPLYVQKITQYLDKLEVYDD